MSAPPPHPLHHYPAPSEPPIGEQSDSTAEYNASEADPDHGGRPKFIVAVAAAVLFGALTVQLVPWAAQRLDGDEQSPRDITIDFFDALGKDPDGVIEVLAIEDPNCIASGDPEVADLLSRMLEGVAFADVTILRETTAADGESATVWGQVRIDRQASSPFRLEFTVEASRLGAQSWRVCDFTID